MAQRADAETQTDSAHLDALLAQLEADHVRTKRMVAEMAERKENLAACKERSARWRERSAGLMAVWALSTYGIEVAERAVERGARGSGGSRQ